MVQQAAKVTAALFQILFNPDDLVIVLQHDGDIDAWGFDILRGPSGDGRMILSCRPLPTDREVALMSLRKVLSAAVILGSLPDAAALLIGGIDITYIAAERSLLSDADVTWVWQEFHKLAHEGCPPLVVRTRRARGDS